MAIERNRLEKAPKSTMGKGKRDANEDRKRSDTSLRGKLKPTGTSELPHLIWDLCDGLFRSLGDKFKQSSGEYFEYIRPRVEAALGQQNDLLEQSSEPGLDLRTSGIVQKVKRIRDVFSVAGIDLVAVHFRSRRERPDSPRVLRVLGGSLIQQHNLDSDYCFGKWRLTRHAFDKVRENGMLFFHFDTQSDGELRADTVVDECRIGTAERELMVEVLERLQKQEGPQEILPTVIRDAINRKFPRDEEFSAGHIRKYCREHLQEDQRERFEGDEEAIGFVIESCIITLTLLADGKLAPPRSILMTPVFVGSERVGGVSFFSKHAKKLQDASKDLKIFARNLLTYLAVRESHEVEVDKRILEELSPITHLFIHTFNKAFTTPILNISDELDRLPAEIAKLERDESAELAFDRLHSIAVFLRSFARRWGGTFPALQAMAGTSPRGPDNLRPRFVKATYTQLPEAELEDHLASVFSVSMGNDIFDDAEFSSYRSVLSSFEGLKRIVRLRMDLPHRVPGHRDIWCLHLLNLMQNSVEALPLHDALWRKRENPAYLTPEFTLKVSSRLGDASRIREQIVIIEVRDSGSGFSDDILECQKNILSEFAQTQNLPPTLWEVQRRIRSAPSSYSSKSGESYGSGLVCLADYLSRICRVRWRPERAPDYDAGSLIEGEIVERGSVDISSSGDGAGAIVRLTVPVDGDYEENVEDYRSGVFFEMR